MKYEEYEALINEAISNTDKSPVNLKSVLEGIKADLTTMNAGTEKLKEYEGRIKDLQDTNIKLFLGTTGKQEEHDDPEPKKETIEEWAAKRREEMLKDDKG